MALNRDGWVLALSDAYTNLQAVRDLAEAIDNARAVPVGLVGAQYEFAMTPAQLTQAKADLLGKARAARDRLTVAIQATITP